MSSRISLFVAVASLLLLASPAVLAEVDYSDVHNAVAAALKGQSSSGLITHFDPGSGLLVVVDAAGKTTATYRAGDNGLVFLGRRDLETDLRPGGGDVSAEPPPPRRPPRNDVPGEDPPGAPRLDGWVRMGSSFDRGSSSTVWGARYLAPGDAPEIFAAILTSLEGWQVEKTQVQGGLHPHGTIKARKGSTNLEIGIRYYSGRDYPGYMAVHTTVRQDRS